MQDRQKGKGWFVNEYNIIYVQGTVEGKFFRKSTNKEANKINLKWIEKNARDVLLKLISNKAPKKTSSFFKEFAYQVLEVTKDKRNDATNKDYKQKLEKYIIPFFKNYKLEDIKPLDVEHWQNHIKPMFQSTVSPKRCRIILGMILEKAFANDMITKNPVKYAESIKVTYEKTEPYTEPEVRLMLEHAEGWLKVFLLLAFSTGMRTGEIMALKWDDIDFNDRCINLQRSITKGKITESDINTDSTKNHFRIIELIPDVVKALALYYEQRHHDEWLFVSKYKEPYAESKTIVNYHFKPFLKKLGIKYKTLYATRHTFTSMMLNNGFDKTWVKNMLGHSPNSSVTEAHYFSYQKDDKRLEAVNNLFMTKKQKAE